MEKIEKSVSLVMSVYNEEETITGFLNSYMAQTKYADEVIILDGGSKDDTVKKIQNFVDENTKLNINVIVDRSCSKEFTKGPIAKARNIAIESSKSKIIAVTDGGCILPANWLEEITKPLLSNAHNVDVVSGWYEGLGETPFQKTYKKLFMPKIKNINSDEFLPSSRSIAFKKNRWQQVGGYPEKTYTAEDTLFDIRLKKIGCKFIFARNAVVYWQCPKSISETLKKMYNYSNGDGLNRLFLKRYLVRFATLFVPIDLFVSPTKLRYFYIAYLVTVVRVVGYIIGLSASIKISNK